MRKRGLRPFSSKQRAYFYARETGMRAIDAWAYAQQLMVMWG